MPRRQRDSLLNLALLEARSNQPGAAEATFRKAVAANPPR